MAENELVDAALVYAERGWPVLPLHTPVEGGCSCRRPDCSSVGKHPRVARGFYAATTDHAVIRRWWRRWPDANVGIRTGAVSGIVVVDVDPRHGGRDSLRRLQKRRALPATFVVRTGGGGVHLYFAHPGGVVRNDAGRLGAGIDIRGDGGFVVAPPSAHASGKLYSVRCGVQLAQTPEGLIVSRAAHAVCHSSARGSGDLIDRAIARAESEVERAVEGTRNDTLNRVAFRVGRLAARVGVEPAVVTERLAAAGQRAGLGRPEAELTAERAMTAGASRRHVECDVRIDSAP